jgi:hypothetical protein
MLPCIVELTLNQRDLNDLFSIGAVQKKGQAPISWRSKGVEGWADIMRGVNDSNGSARD